MQHLTYDDYELYLDTENLSDEYLCRMDVIMEHLDSCERCQKLLQRMRLISLTCDEENIGGSLDALKGEAEMRRELLSLRLEKKEQDERIHELVQCLRAGMLMEMMVSKADMLRRATVARGTGDEARKTPVVIQYEDGKAKVSVDCPEGKEVSVIMEPYSSLDEVIIKTVRATEEGTATLEFDMNEKDERYTFYIDL